MLLDLPYPHKALWPNGRFHWAAKAREVKKHKNWAFMSARQKPLPTFADGKVPVRLVVHPKATGPLPDKDNCIAALKAYQDGIAAAIGIDDKHFAAPTVEFSDRRTGRFKVEIGNV